MTYAGTAWRCRPYTLYTEAFACPLLERDIYRLLVTYIFVYLRKVTTSARVHQLDLAAQQAGGASQLALAIVLARVGAANGTEHGLAGGRASTHRAPLLHTALRTVPALHLRTRIDP